MLDIREKNYLCTSPRPTVYNHLLFLPGDDEAAAEDARPGSLLRAHDPAAADAVADEVVLARLALARVPARHLRRAGRALVQVPVICLPLPAGIL